MGHVGEHSVERKRDTFSPVDRDALAALALALPPEWVAVVDSGGQIGITPAQYVHNRGYVIVASGESRRIRVRPWWYSRGSGLDA